MRVRVAVRVTVAVRVGVGVRVLVGVGVNVCEAVGKFSGRSPVGMASTARPDCERSTT